MGIARVRFLHGVGASFVYGAAAGACRLRVSRGGGARRQERAGSGMAGDAKLALCQLAVTADKAANLSNAVQRIEEAAGQGARVVVLPECFNCPYGVQYFDDYAEELPCGPALLERSPSARALSEAAARLGVHIVGGSIPERDGDHLYNTSLVFDSNGDNIARHRKLHLFDIDVPGKIRFQESEVLTAGSSLCTFPSPLGDIGVGICYDIRFPELAAEYGRRGCRLLVYPGAFNMTTGPAHWELLQRARAVDNQVFVAACSPARDESATYTAWGHSTVVDPWGTVLGRLDEKPGVLVVSLPSTEPDGVRTSIPILRQKRHDLFDLGRWLAKP